jgi:hypothetical protein
MNDGTRAPSGVGEARSWLDPLVAPPVRVQIASSIEIGRSLLPLVDSWSDRARQAIGAFESGLRGRDVPDDLFAFLERLVGVRELVDLVAGLAETSDRVAASSDEE